MQANICIIGGGFCGTIVAHALTTLGIDCALLEKKAALPIPKDNRAFVLSYGSSLLLNNMGLWQSTLVDHQIQQIQYSMKGFFGSTTIKSCNYNVPYLGSVIKAKNWQEHCIKKAKLPKKTFCGIEIKHIIRKNNKTFVEFEHNNKTHSMQTEFIIAADGSHSWTNNQLGLNTRTTISDYSALIVPANNVACKTWLKSTDMGHLAYIPHNDSSGVLIWTAPTAIINKLQDPKKLIRFSKNTARQALINSTIEVSKIQTFPVTATHNDISKKNNIPGVSIGNALHTLPPLAAQGFNLGIRDCATIIEMLSQNNYDYNYFLKTRIQDGKNTLKVTMQALSAYKNAKKYKAFASLGLLAANIKANYKFHQNMLQALGLQAPYNKLVFNKLEKLL